MADGNEAPSPLVTSDAELGGVELDDVVRSFGSVRALDGASLHARAGEVHALLGENGAGKSTLAHLLAGELQPDSGELRVLGKTVSFKSPREAVKASIGIVHQHFKLVPALTGLENVALWSLGGLGRLDLEGVRVRAVAVAAALGMTVELEVPVDQLSVGARQRIEIVKLLYSDPKVLVLDEPTAVLAPGEIEELFVSLRRLAAEGRVVILIAHKLDEVLGVADRVTVLRHGRTVLESAREGVDADTLARAMVGTAVPEPVERTDTVRGDRIARAQNVTVLRRDGGRGAEALVLDVYRGEIVAVAGVEGNGQRELALAFAGFLAPDSGLLELPARIGFIPQDRSREGVVGPFSLTENVALGFRTEPAFRKGPFVLWDAAQAKTAELIDRYDVRTAGPDAAARTLSGGNQQKLIVAREVDRDPDLVVAENPTRGLDIAATRFVRAELVALRNRDPAPAVLVVSTDLDEVLELGDRLFVMVRGRLVEVPEKKRSRDEIGRLMLTSGP